MASAGTNGAVPSSVSSTGSNATTEDTVQVAKDIARPSTSEPDDDHRKRALQEYCDRVPCKMVEVFSIDESRISMYKELQKNYDRNLSWARSMGIDPLAENFNPSTPAPPELSAWLYLFHSYLQLEEVYLETMEWLNCKGRRLIDPARPWKSVNEEAKDCWNAFVQCFTLDRGRPGSRASQHKQV